MVKTSCLTADLLRIPHTNDIKAYRQFHALTRGELRPLTSTQGSCFLLSAVTSLSYGPTGVGTVDENDVLFQHFENIVLKRCRHCTVLYGFRRYICFLHFISRGSYRGLPLLASEKNLYSYDSRLLAIPLTIYYNASFRTCLTTPYVDAVF